MTLAAGTRLGPYQILAPLGAGGMGEVYRARDSRLQREVAVKVLPETLAMDHEALARFEREARAVAALSHPNILAIFDYGTEGTVAYAVTELLEGESLSARLASGPLPRKEAVEYALQIAKGLSAAHERGVVHRDLKPDNVFVGTDGHVKILDFGLAKRQEKVAPGEETSAPTASGHTEPGTVMGTVGYMSPEQVRGLPLDHRSDLFSFGAILYEMLSGQRAFKRATAADTMAAIMLQEPPELMGSARNISPALDRVVKHCLEKDRANRFQTARDVAFALSEASSPEASRPYVLPGTARVRWFVSVAAVLILVGAAIYLWKRPKPPAPSVAGTKRVAVLPFENQGAPEDDYFADGMADEVRTKLTSLPGVEVIARASSTEYKKTTKKPKQIADELGVRYLLTATVRWQKSSGAARVHVTPELIEVKESGAPASNWQQTFDASLTDVFQVQADIASKVADALGVVLGESRGKQLARKPTENLAAYDAFLKAQENNRSDGGLDGPSLRTQIGLYEQAVALDPNFAEAWARLSISCSRYYFNNERKPELKERAGVAAQRAYSLAPEGPSSFAALGVYQDAVMMDNPRSLEEYNRGLRIAPQNAELVALAGSAEANLGRWDEAVASLRQAQRLDPRSVRIPARLGTTLLWLRRYVEAREALDGALALAPANSWITADKIRTYLGQGDLAGARAILRNLPRALDVTALVSVLTIFDVVWVMEKPELEILDRVTPAVFSDDKGFLQLALTEASVVRGDGASARLHAEAARNEFESQMHDTPDDPFAHTKLGLALAYLGRKDDAVREGLRGVSIESISRDATWGPIAESLLIRIYVLVGENEKALDGLEHVLKVPGYLSPGWLKIDPNFDPLRNNPRFQKLVAGK
jgi:TolB-like protein/Flp pilus assembly protein TadD